AVECGTIVTRHRRRETVRFIILGLAAVALLAPRPVAAQDWIEYASKDDLFSVNFPQEPKIEKLEYVSQQGAPLPGRAYRATEGQSRYVMTVIDYTHLEEIQQELIKKC